MTKDEFESKYEIVWGEAETLNPGTIKVMFNQRQGFLKDRVTGSLLSTGVYVGSGGEEFGDVLVIERYVTK